MCIRDSGQIECHVERTDERVTAVGVAREVSLRYPSYQVANAAFACIDSCNAQEEMVASGDEGIGRSACRLFFVHRDGSIGQGVLGQLTDEADIHCVKVYLSVSGNLFRNFYLEYMLLSVGEAQRIDFFEMFLGPIEASG